MTNHPSDQHQQATTQIAAVTCHLNDAGQVVVRLIDQRLLPTQEIWRDYLDAEAVAQAITDMVVRGAPAIGVTAGYGLAQAMHCAVDAGEDWDEAWRRWQSRFAATRPTAVNLFWAIDRLDQRQRADAGPDALKDPAALKARTAGLLAEAQAIHDEDRAACAAMGRFGAAVLPQSGGVLHHCNTGALATGGIGTALGVLRAALAAGKDLHIWVDETRPYLQGARLTAWECVQDNLPATLITDNMAGWMMQQGHIAAAIVGSDRIAANGDVANKIGTYAVAVLCKYHGIPFYVAAPTSTVDLACPTGEQIPIEQRSGREVSHVGGWAPAELLTPLAIAPEGIAIKNPAFDVTPAALVTAIITEQGVARAPYGPALQAMVHGATTAT